MINPTLTPEIGINVQSKGINMKITEVYVCAIESPTKRWEVEYAGEKYLIELSHMSRGTMTDDEWHKASGVLCVSNDGFFAYQLTNFSIAESAEPELFALAILRFEGALEKRLQENE